MQCNFEKSTLAVVDKWAQMGFNTEQLFHPIADLYSGTYNSVKHRDLLCRYVAKAHRRDLRIILYLNVHILGPSLMEKRHEWSMRGPDGSVIMHYDGVYASICLNSPWRDRFFQTLEEVGELGVDGVFLDGPIVGECSCAHCKTAYESWFGERERDETARWEFANRTQQEFLSQAYRLWHERFEDRPIYRNLPVLHASRSYVDVKSELPYNDIAGTEGGFQHYGPARNAFLFKPSFTARLLESVAPDKPRVIFMAADHKPWSWWMHTPVETIHTIATCAANASSVWYGLHGSTDLLGTPGAEAAGRVFRFLKANERYYDDTQSAATVALLYSYATERFHSRSVQESDFVRGEKPADSARGDMTKAAHGYYQMLVESRIAFDVVTDLACDLSRYKVVIVPSCGALESATVEQLQEFVRAGGTLIAQLDSSMVSGLGSRFDSFALSDVLGVSPTGPCRKRTSWNYVRITSPKQRRIAGAELLPSPLVTIPVSAARGAETLAWSLKDMPGRYTEIQEPEHPFLVRNGFGKGCSWYFAGGFGEMAYDYYPREYRLLLDGIVRAAAGPQIVIENAPALLEVVHRKQGSRHIVHLINYGASALRPSGAVTTACNVKITLPRNMKVDKVRSLVLRRRLAVSRNTFIVPELREFDVLVVE